MGNSVMLNGVEYAGEQIAYKDSTYELVSKVAYLIGVPDVYKRQVVDHGVFIVWIWGRLRFG